MMGASLGTMRRVSARGWIVLSLTVPAMALPGCTSPLGLAAAGADVVTLNATKKTIGDHIVSAATGRDCSILSFEKDGDYCPDKVEVDRSRLYCYRTLADVECHHIPDPYRNGNTALASPPPDVRILPRKRGWFDDATPYSANSGS